jgi:hypothetical protein
MSSDDDSGPNVRMAPAAQPWIRLYERDGEPAPQVVPSPVGRTWYSKAAYHCTPLLAAGQLGWTVLSPAPIEARWDGGNQASAVKFRRGLPRRAPGFAVTGWFGRGTISISLGLHVRTSSDVDLLVKDPPNVCKHGAKVVEGLIETDWFDGVFPITIKLTRADEPVRWEEGEPLCQLVPYPRGWIEQFQTERVTHGEDHAEYFTAVDHWTADREAVIRAQLDGDDPGWDRQYIQGRGHDGRRAPESHRTRLRVSPFPGMDEIRREL